MHETSHKHSITEWLNQIFSSIHTYVHTLFAKALHNPFLQVGKKIHDIIGLIMLNIIAKIQQTTVS